MKDPFFCLYVRTRAPRRNFVHKGASHISRRIRPVFCPHGEGGTQNLRQTSFIRCQAHSLWKAFHHRTLLSSLKSASLVHMLESLWRSSKMKQKCFCSLPRGLKTQFPIQGVFSPPHNITAALIEPTVQVSEHSFPSTKHGFKYL